MKKLLAVLMAAVMMLGCVSALAEDPYASLGNYEMIVGHAQPEGNPRWVSMEKFAEDVKEKTHGHVTVTATNQVTIFARDGREFASELKSKREIAEEILQTAQIYIQK